MLVPGLDPGLIHTTLSSPHLRGYLTSASLLLRAEMQTHSFPRRPAASELGSLRHTNFLVPSPRVQRPAPERVPRAPHAATVGLALDKCLPDKSGDMLLLPFFLKKVYTSTSKTNSEQFLFHLSSEK